MVDILIIPLSSKLFGVDITYMYYNGERKHAQKNQGFGSAFFLADPDPGKNLHADPDPDPDPGGIRGRGLGVKGKNEFF